jgi:hypothetical protein
MEYSSVGKIKRKKIEPNKVENFSNKVNSVLSLLVNLKISEEEKELLKMSLDSMNEFIANHYGEKK